LGRPGQGPSPAWPGNVYSLLARKNVQALPLDEPVLAYY